MRTRYLFPHSFKKVGWVILIPAVILGLLKMLEILPLPELIIPVFNTIEGGFMGEKGFTWTTNDITDELLLILTVLGALMVTCSREKIEDEYITKIRLESLLWATYFNFGLLIVATMFIYGSPFLIVMQFNLVTVLLIFLLRFNFVLARNAKVTHYEEYA